MKSSKPNTMDDDDDYEEDFTSKKEASSANKGLLFSLFGSQFYFISYLYYMLSAEIFSPFCCFVSVFCLIS